MKKLNFCLIIFAFFSLISCRTDEYINREETESGLAAPENTAIKGFYLLNEGNMGSNKATLDFFDYTTGTYHRNIYAEINPNVVKELGDVGNDIQIYGNKMYAVINVSNKIEVLDAKTAKRIKTINLENCRYITFKNGKAYASSYAGPVSIDPNAPLGKVVEIDTTSLTIQRTAVVGYQPEEMEIIGDKLFVANSGGYKFPNYDRTVSVVDLSSFTETNKIDVAINLHHVKKDNYGDLYVTSRGDYYTVPSSLFLVDPVTGIVKKDFHLSVSEMTIVNDKLYYYGNEFNYNTHTYKKSFGIIDVKTEEIISNKLIDQEYVDAIKTPYGIAVNPITEDIYLTDARNYVSTGFVYCFDKNGHFKWKTEGGNIPAHFTFLYK
ncbi:YncE family protein [Chryseobacterium sp. MMS23-Vi53]|uniref:YncE family protein n=1 Tax=Chryseobacterium sp. MMS23-Vi53 TaxID=3386644 RepID=UPI0039E95B34